MATHAMDRKRPLEGAMSSPSDSPAKRLQLDRTTSSSASPAPLNGASTGADQDDDENPAYKGLEVSWIWQRWRTACSQIDSSIAVTTSSPTAKKLSSARCESHKGTSQEQIARSGLCNNL